MVEHVQWTRLWVGAETLTGLRLQSRGDDRSIQAEGIARTKALRPEHVPRGQSGGPHAEPVSQCQGGEASRFSGVRGYLFKVKCITGAVKSGQLG